MSYVQYNEQSIHIPEISIQETILVILNLSNSAAGHDEMPASIMKQLVNYYAVPLTFLINKSLTQGIFSIEIG